MTQSNLANDGHSNGQRACILWSKGERKQAFTVVRSFIMQVMFQFANHPPPPLSSATTTATRQYSAIAVN